VRLLVSVRDAEEARAALAGGAEIIDAKEPASGALGPVAPATLRAIRDVVPSSVPLSAALGDIRDEAQLLRALAGSLPPLDFVKLGFSGVEDPGLIRQLLQAARLSLDPGTALVAVAYADWTRVRALPPEAVAAALPAGVAGLLVDTACKDGAGLFDLFTPDRLRTLHSSLRGAGRWLALGGSLTREMLRAAVSTGAEVCGVRGAAAADGRNGTIDVGRVRALRAELERQRPTDPSRSTSVPISPIGRTDHRVPTASAREK